MQLRERERERVRHRDEEAKEKVDMKNASRKDLGNGCWFIELTGRKKRPNIY